MNTKKVQVTEKTENFYRLAIWLQSVNLVKNIYAFIEKLPDSEQNGLTQQLRDTVLSISINVADCQWTDDFKQQDRKLLEIMQFLGRLQGLVLVAESLGFCSKNLCQQIEQECLVLNMEAKRIRKDLLKNCPTEKIRKRNQLSRMQESRMQDSKSQPTKHPHLRVLH